MLRLRAMKMLCATLLVCAGAMCVSISEFFRDLTLTFLLGLVLLAVGLPMLVRQWTGRGVLSHVLFAWNYFVDGWYWFLGWSRAPRAGAPTEPTTGAEMRA